MVALIVGGFKIMFEWNHLSVDDATQNNFWFRFGIFIPFLTLIGLFILVTRRKVWASYCLAAVSGIFALFGFFNGNLESYSGAGVIIETVAYAGVVYFVLHPSLRRWMKSQ